MSLTSLSTGCTRSSHSSNNANRALDALEDKTSAVLANNTSEDDDIVFALLVLAHDQQSELFTDESAHVYHS